MEKSLNKLSIKTKINGVTVLIEPELSGHGIRISGLDKDNVKNGVSVHYVENFGKFVPLDLQVYETGICGKSYVFDCVTGIFTQFIEFSNGCKLVGMDKRTINKHKSDADKYYKQAKNMLGEITESKCPFVKALMYTKIKG